LSRHRKTQFSRTKAIVVAAGALSLATVASATATTWTSGSAGHLSPSGSAATTGLDVSRVPSVNGALQLTGTNQPGITQPGINQPGTNLQGAVAYQLTSVTFAQRASQVRARQTQYAIAQWTAAQKRAAKQAAAARAAAAASAVAATMPAGTIGATATAVATATATATTATAVKSPAPSASPQPTATATAPARSGSPQQIAEAMLGSFGWSSSQFSCLDPLWARESGWSVTAENPSGAYGIPQALPGAKMASAGPDWQTSAATQIKWGLEYIKDTYGSPCAAWAHEEATGWY
jgi:hypothetical protein